MSFVETLGYGQLPLALWRGAKEFFSATARRASYEEQAEFLILSAYEAEASVKPSDPYDPALSKVIEEILDFKNDAKYAKHNVESAGHLRGLGVRFREANVGYMDKYPEIRIERIKRHVTVLYGHEKLDDDVVRDRSVWQRIWDVRIERRKAYIKSRGLTMSHIVIGYEYRVDLHQLTIESVEQVDREGLLDASKLFSQGGNHGSVSRNVEAFDRLLYAEWESSLKPMTEKEKRIEFREFVGHRMKVWGKEYLQWLKTR